MLMITKKKKKSDAQHDTQEEEVQLLISTQMSQL